MKVLYTAIIFTLLSVSLHAQNDWEIPEENKAISEIIDSIDSKIANDNPDSKYLEGAVPMVNGEIYFTQSIETDGNAEENFSRMMSCLATMAKDKDQLPESRISLVNKGKHSIVAHFEEWMVFKSSLFELDKARFIYNILAECEDNMVNIKLFRISYHYEGNDRQGKKIYKAEPWISDKEALTKKKDRLRKGTGKFRRKTIDRIESIFNNIKYELK